MTVVKTYLLAQLPSGAKLSFWRLELPTGAFKFFFKNSCHQKTAKLCFYRHHRPQFIWKGTWVWQVEQQNKRALMKCPKSGDLKSEIQNPKNAINGKRATESPRKQTEEKNKTEDEPEATESEVWARRRNEKRGTCTDKRTEGPICKKSIFLVSFPTS